MTRMLKRIVLVITMLWGSVPLALAQGSAKAGEAPPDPDAGVLMLPHKKATELHGGRVLYAEGVAKPGVADRFGLEGLAVTQPIVVALLPKDLKAQLSLSASKWNPKSPSRQMDTGEAGIARFTFRAQGDARLTVTSKGASTPYQLMVWVGPELRAPMKSPFTKAAADKLRVAKPIAKPNSPVQPGSGKDSKR